MKKLTITIDEDTLLDSIRNGHRAFAKNNKMTDAEAAAWLAANRDKIEEHISYYAIDAAVRSVLRPPVEVTEPVLSFDNGRLQLFVYDAEEIVRMPVLGPCGNEWNAGMIYVESGIGRHENEQNIRHESTWKWIQEWMEKGMKSEGLLQGKSSDLPPELTKP